MVYGSTIANNSRLTELFVTIDSNTNGMFGIGLILVIYIILLVSIKSTNSSYSFTAATFVTFVIANLMYKFGILADSVMVIIWILLILTIISLYGESRSG